MLQRRMMTQAGGAAMQDGRESDVVGDPRDIQPVADPAQALEVTGSRLAVQETRPAQQQHPFHERPLPAFPAATRGSPLWPLAVKQAMPVEHREPCRKP
jgi:hypothetical protein